MSWNPQPKPRPDPAWWWLINKPMYPPIPGVAESIRTWGQAWAERNAHNEPFLRRDYRKKYGHEIDQPPHEQTETTANPESGEW